MKQLIVNADDFNFSPGVNAGILEAFHEGVVTSTSLMVNLPGFDDSVRRLAENPGLGVGVHVVLTKGRPVLPVGEVPSLVDSSGAFRGRPAGVLASARAEEIRREARRQVEMALEAGLPVTHIDSHHHVHQASPVGEILVGIAEELGLAMRSYPETAPLLEGRRVPAPGNLVTAFFAQGATLESLFAVLETLPDGVSELCCHPGIADDALKAMSSYTVDRERELAILSSPEVKAKLKSLGISLASFRDLIQ